MSQKIELLISFSSPNSIALIKAINNSIGSFNQRLPDVITDGYDDYTDTEDWINKLIPKYKRSLNVYWGSIFKYEAFINYYIKEQMVKIGIKNYELTNAQSVIKMLAPLPWTVASIFDFHGDDDDWDEYIAPGFGDFHFQHGWACAFKGEGHKHLVSRRWLQYHPWHLIRDESHDISFVQFHDLEADPATALEQAKPGHRAMSIYGVGGYIGKTHPFSNDLKGLYVPEHRDLRVVIPAGKEITYSEMADYCAARYFQAFEGKPFKILSFVFIVAAEAQPYLHDLWLRNIQCFGFTEEGKEIRLDENYQPVYEPPEWVKKLRVKQQQQLLQERPAIIDGELAKIEETIQNLNDRINNMSGGTTYNQAINNSIRELQQKLDQQIALKSKLQQEKADLEANESE